MSEFGIVEDTMFIPMVGRIYASEKFPGTYGGKDLRQRKVSGYFI